MALWCPYKPASLLDCSSFSAISMRTSLCRPGTGASTACRSHSDCLISVLKAVAKIVAATAQYLQLSKLLTEEGLGRGCPILADI